MARMVAKVEFFFVSSATLAAGQELRHPPTTPFLKSLAVPPKPSIALRCTELIAVFAAGRRPGVKQAKPLRHHQSRLNLFMWPANVI